jgi:glycerol-3-phosphate acyltransferase PlsY
LFGCFLTAEVVARAFAHTSIFKLGDGNPGMANVGHELGTKAALICLAGDILKTALAATLSHGLFPDLGTLAIGWAGLGATLGHVFPFWHGFRGSKGVTTIGTTVFLLDFLAGILAALVALVTIVLSGYLSVAALVSMAFCAIMMIASGQLELALIYGLFMLLTVYCHWSKLVGIKDGTTHRASLSTKFRSKVRGH